MRHLHIAGVMCALLSASAMAADPFITFDFEQGRVESGFGPWAYEDAGSNNCGTYNGETLSKLCTDSGLSIYAHYNPANNDHIGWMRYGFIDAEATHSISGHALRVQMTGGIRRDENGQLVQLGEEVFSKSMYAPEELENVTLPGELSLYFKTATSTTPFEQFQNANRLTMWVKFPEEYRGMEGYNKATLGNALPSLSWYPFVDTSTRGHYYHPISNVRMGGWTKVQFDAHPIHHNGGVEGPNNSLREGGYEYTGDSQGYFANITTFALRALFAQGMTPLAHYIIDDFATDLVLYENEETISSMAIGFDPHSQRFDIGFADKYRCADCFAKYEVRYSFSPINNANFAQAHVPAYTFNFDRDLSNEQGVINKAHPGYNHVWAAFELQEQHRSRIVEGETLYFAVRDISLREVAQDFADLSYVDVPDVGRVQHQRLVKTISYPIHMVATPIEFGVTELPAAAPNAYYKGKVPFRGGIAPFDIEMLGEFPPGLTIDSYGNIEGVPIQVGDYPFTLIVRDAVGAENTISETITVASNNVVVINQCRLLVDFMDSAEETLIADPRFNAVFHDRYTGFTPVGTRIYVGENKDYDYQGIRGGGYALSAGDTLRMTWHNTDDAPVIFRPRVSFEVAGRYSRYDAHQWYTAEAHTIEPGARSVVQFVLPEDVSGELVNVNVNHTQRGTLVLDKLELVEPQRPEQANCEESIDGPTFGERAVVLVDFDGSADTSRRSVAGLQTVIHDVYTRFKNSGIISDDGAQHYNYQGVKGSGFVLKSGDKIRVTWRNTEGGYRSFYPKISFDDTDRFGRGMHGKWWSMGHVTLSPTRRQTTTLVIDEAQAGEAIAVNVAQNNPEAHLVSVEKIEIILSRSVMGLETTELPLGILSQPYSHQLTYAGTDEEVYFVSNTTLPKGLELRGDGLLSGWPTQVGTFSLSVGVYNESGESANKQLQLEIVREGYGDTPQCRLLVSFDPTAPHLDPDFSTIITDRYTDVHETGMTTVIGSNGGYNYQGVVGNFDNTRGGQLRLEWFNNSSEKRTFAPRASVLSDARYSRYAPEGTWLDGEAITLLPGERGVSVVTLPEGRFDVINVNSNASGNRAILLENIEHVSPKYGENSVCPL